MSATDSQQPEQWRIVVLTNIVGGIVYRLVDSVAAELGHKVVGVVTTPGRPGHRDPAYLEVVQAVRPGIDTIVTSHPNRIATMIAPMRPDILISGGFPWLLPEDVIRLPRVAAINGHPSLLPRYRGPHSLSWVFRDDAPEAGFTVHMLDGSFDTGPILAQRSVPVLDSDDVHALLGRMGEQMPGVVAEALQKLAHGTPGTPQNESQSSYAPALEPEWRFIDWNQPSRTIHNQVRSWTGMRGIALGAIGEIDGAPTVITRTALSGSDATTPNRGRPGDIIERSDGQILVQCGDLPIALLDWHAADRADV